MRRHIETYKRVFGVEQSCEGWLAHVSFVVEKDSGLRVCWMGKQGRHHAFYGTLVKLIMRAPKSSTQETHEGAVLPLEKGNRIPLWAFKLGPHDSSSQNG